MSAKKSEQVDLTEIPISPIKKIICLVQLTRIGDVIQVLQTAIRLKETRDDIDLIFIGRKEFSKPLNFLLKNVFDHVIYLDLSQMLREGNNQLSGTIQILNNFIEKINCFKISALINYSFSRSSGYLCSLIKAEHRLGIHYDNNSNLLIQDQWSQFTYSNVLATPYNPFSLVDIYFKTLGVKQYIERIPTVRKIVNKKIVIHPFSSHKKKKWKETKWIEVIFRILKSHPESEIHIVGSKEEESSAKEITSSIILKSFSSRLTSHVGQFTIQETYQLLSESDLFIGHDSMVGHLASIQGIQILTISLGTVRPIETTPYISGAYVITPKTKCFPCPVSKECDLPQCHLDISFQFTCSVIDLLLEKKEINHHNIIQNNIQLHLGSIELYKVFFNKKGFLSLSSIINNKENFRDIMLKVYRVTWNFLFDEIEEKIQYPNFSQVTHSELLKTLEGLQNLYELSEFGKKYTKYILGEISSDTPDIQKIKDYSSKIDEIDKLKDIIKDSHQGTSPIINYYKMKKNNLTGNNLVQLTENSFLIYHECSQCCSIVYELIENIIAEYKISNNVKIHQNDQSL